MLVCVCVGGGGGGVGERVAFGVIDNTRELGLNSVRNFINFKTTLCRVQEGLSDSIIIDGVYR